MRDIGGWELLRIHGGICNLTLRVQRLQNSKILPKRESNSGLLGPIF